MYLLTAIWVCFPLSAFYWALPHTAGSHFLSIGNFLFVAAPAEFLPLPSHWDVPSTRHPAHGREAKQLLTCTWRVFFWQSFDEPHAELFVVSFLRGSLCSRYHPWKYCWCRSLQLPTDNRKIFSSCFPSPPFLLLWLGEREASSLPSPPPAWLTNAHTDGILPGNNSVSPRWSLPGLFTFTEVSEAHIVIFNHKNLTHRQNKALLSRACSAHARVPRSQVPSWKRTLHLEMVSIWAPAPQTPMTLSGQGHTTMPNTPVFLTLLLLFSRLKNLLRKTATFNFGTFWKDPWDGSNFSHATSWKKTMSYGGTVGLKVPKGNTALDMLHLN